MDKDIDKQMSPAEMRVALSLLMKREEERLLAVEQEKERLALEKKEQAEAAHLRMLKSIEILKWCQLSISGVMVGSFLVAILVLVELEREAQAIKQDVVAIEAELQSFYTKLSNPFETLGQSLGKKIEKELGFDDGK